MINMIFFFMYMVAIIGGHPIDGMKSAVKEVLDIERELKLINKSPIKTIHTKLGYIVDCIDINKQPAFDHPLLINHKLQRKPSFKNKMKKSSVKKSSTKAIFGLEKYQCPKGTVPIKRITRDDLIQGKSFFNNLLFQDNTVNHVAEVALVPGAYYGVGGTTSIYNVKVENDQSSSAMMWVQNGPTDSANLIGIGWHVAPHLYNDNEVHLYVIWTTDGYKSTGCFNLQCSGFVQTSKENYLGAVFDGASIYNKTMIEITLSIIQDPKTKNWWLSNENENLGYFPASLFPNLSAASQVGWGGRTSTSPGAPSPPMGSGHIPDNDFTHASYFKHITYQNDARTNQGPDKVLAKAFSDKPNCFSAEYYGDQGGEVGFSLQFGGPGGNCDA